MSGGVLDRLAERFVGAMSWGVPDWEGRVVDFGIFTPGQRGIARPVPWDAFASATVRGVREDEVHYALTRDARVICKEHVPAASLEPLAHALREEIDPPFVAIAIRDEGDVWVEAANRAEVVELPARGEEIVVSRVSGAVTATVDGKENHGVSFPRLERLVDGDGTVIAHRFVGSAWVAETFSL